MINLIMIYALFFLVCVIYTQVLFICTGKNTDGQPPLSSRARKTSRSESLYEYTQNKSKRPTKKR